MPSVSVSFVSAWRHMTCFVHVNMVCSCSLINGTPIVPVPHWLSPSYPQYPDNSQWGQGSWIQDSGSRLRDTGPWFQDPIGYCQDIWGILAIANGVQGQWGFRSVPSGVDGWGGHLRSCWTRVLLYLATLQSISQILWCPLKNQDVVT